MAEFKNILHNTQMLSNCQKTSIQKSVKTQVKGLHYTFPHREPGFSVLSSQVSTYRLIRLWMHRGGR